MQLSACLSVLVLDKPNTICMEKLESGKLNEANVLLPPCQTSNTVTRLPRAWWAISSMPDEQHSDKAGGLANETCSLTDISSCHCFSANQECFQQWQWQAKISSLCAKWQCESLGEEWLLLDGDVWAGQQCSLHYGNGSMTFMMWTAELQVQLPGSSTQHAWSMPTALRRLFSGVLGIMYLAPMRLKLLSFPLRHLWYFLKMAFAACIQTGSEGKKWLHVKSANVHHISTFYTKQQTTSVTTEILEKKMVCNQKVLKYNDIMIYWYHDILAFLELF